MGVEEGCLRVINRPSFPRTEGLRTQGFQCKNQESPGQMGTTWPLDTWKGFSAICGEKKGGDPQLCWRVPAAQLWSLLMTQVPDLQSSMGGASTGHQPLHCCGPQSWTTLRDSSLISKPQQAGKSPVSKQACGGVEGGERQTAEQREVERGRGVLPSNPGRRFREVTGPFLPVPSREPF